MVITEITIRFKCLLEYLIKNGYTVDNKSFANTISVSSSMVTEIMKGRSNVGLQAIQNTVSNYPVNPNWILKGEGDMLIDNEDNPDNLSGKKNLIPFYDDVSTIGGVNTMSASMEGRMPSNEFIDAGDWFIGATAAIRHYGDSMNEYPSGCILALKEIHDKRQIVWGRNYCVETDEMRVTKRLQAGSDEYLMAYSTNTETYPDGHLVHEPFPIYKETIRRIFMVIGCVIKEYSTGPVMIKND